jgi:hypothetical protein
VVFNHWKSFTLIFKRDIEELNSVALVRKQTLPTERPPLVGEVEILKKMTVI